MNRRRGLALGVALVGTVAVALAPVPGLSSAGRAALATGWFAAVCWLTEALPLPVTALCVPVLSTLLGVYPRMAPALTGFADPIIFLLFAGFALAAALQRHDLDRRVAYRLLGALGTTPRRLVLAVMVTTALLSMLVSNTATAAMMAPVALGIAEQVTATRTDAGPVEGDARRVDGNEENHERHEDSSRPNRGASPGTAGGSWAERAPNIEVAMLLGVAYAASVGGVGTLVGTPPNAIVVATLREQLGVEVTFVDWLAIGLPLAVVGLPVVWYLLVYRLFPPAVTDVSAARRAASRYLAEVGPLTPAARRTVVVVGGTAFLWVLGGLGFLFQPYLPAPVYTTLFGGVGPSLLGRPGHQGALYFVLVGLAAVPTLVALDALAWEDLEGIDWGTLVLLGGGLSLADALARTDAVRWLAEATVGNLGGVPALGVVLVVVALTVFVGELASNTAMVAVLAPLLVVVGPEYAATLGTSGETAAAFLAVAGAVAASFGFALPVATPPNAIVFGTGAVTRRDMLRAGLPLDVLFVLVTTAMLFVLFPVVWPFLVG